MNQFYLFAGRNCRVLFLSFFIFCFVFQSNSQPIISFHSVAGGLSSPIDVVNAGDNTNRIFIAQQAGTIAVYDQSFTSLGNFLTVTGLSSGGERGLLSLAFHPDYKNNGFFFVYYTNTNGDVEIARYHTPSGTPNQADAASKKVLLTIPHPGQSNHNGGKLNFGVDGYLYFATGDGGGGGDVPNNAQTGTVLLGKMIRINVSTDDIAPYYSIPSDNPFISNAAFRPEIWSFGLRNPFRWSFDRLTHDMWIADVGQDAWEELNFRPAGQSGGLNYGWHCIEGTHPYNGGCPLDPANGTYAPPLFDYPHNNATGGFAIIGGFVYRGTLNPIMTGYYIFADEVSSNVWLLPPGGGAADTIEFRGLQANISSFGEAENGELYATSLNGQLYNIIATNNASLPVKLLNFTGTAETGYNELSWQTADEVQLQQYEIEYSSDAVHFQQAGIVAAANSSAYYYKHVVTSAQKLYYRLKMVDIDGKFVYSKVIVIDANNSGSKNFVTPSVVSNGMLTVNIENAFSHLQIINMDGKVIHNESVNNRTGKISVSVAGIPAGQYLVRLFGNDKQLTQKIIVQ
jgi:glucose/arabinose dehydrogenase